MAGAGDAQWQRVKQQVQELVGERGKSPALRKPGAALKQQSKAVSAAPTAADFNLLVSDIAAILKVLNGG